MNKIIFKVQISLFTTNTQPEVLIYNEDRTLEGTFPVNDDIKKMAKGRPKFFIYGEMQGSEIVFLKEAPWQDW